MTEKRFRTGKGIFEEGYPSESIIDNKTGKIYYKGYANYKSAKEMCELLNKLTEENEHLKNKLKFFNELNKPYGDIIRENEQLKFENKNLKVTIKAREVLIAVCKKKFRELGFIITVDDDGYVIE